MKGIKLLLIIINILAILMIANVSGATLLDSEDFEGVNNMTDLLASGNWGCASPPSCASQTGAGLSEALIITSGSNNYLSMYASGYVPSTHSARVDLYRNTTPLTALGSADRNYTMKFDVRGFAYYDAGLFSNMKNVGTRMGEAYWNGVTNIGFNIISGSYVEGQTMGHFYNGGIPTELEYGRYRQRYVATLGVAPYSKPINTTCDVSDNQWHTITKIYNFEYLGGARNLTKIRLYQDEDLCYELNGSWSGTFGAGEYPFSRIDFAIMNIAILNIDNLEFYEGEQLPTATTNCSDSIDNDGDGFIDYGQDPSCSSLADTTEHPADSFCSTWELPYYMIENFNGYLNQCDWLVSHNVLYSGTLDVNNESVFYIQKDNDLVSDDNTRYVALSFDQTLYSVQAVSTITYRLYDSNANAIFSIFFRDSGQDLWYVEDGTSKVAYSNISLGIDYPYLFVIDLEQDTFDIYFNDTKVVDDSNLRIQYLNVNDIQTFKLDSNTAEYDVDNLYIYASDEFGVAILPDAPLIPVAPDNTTSMCGYFFKETPTCTQDSDCASGRCSPNNKCSAFDSNYCTENGKVYGSGCFASAITTCTLETAKDIILDNFLLFLVFLIILMIIIYVVLIFKK